MRHDRRFQPDDDEADVREVIRQFDAGYPIGLIAATVGWTRGEVELELARQGRVAE